MIGFQAARAAPIVLGRVVENPQTVATAIRIGNPASWQAAVDAVKKSSGAIDSVTDEEILRSLCCGSRYGRSVLRTRLGGLRGRRDEQAVKVGCARAKRSYARSRVMG